MNKKKIIIVILLLIVLALLSTCITVLILKAKSDDDKPAPNIIDNQQDESIDTKEEKKSSIQILNKTDKSENNNVIIDISYPQITGHENKEVEDKINMVLFNHYKDIKESNLKNMNNTLEEMNNEIDHKSFGITEKYEMKSVNDDILSIVFMDYTYTGGAHGMTYQSSYTIDLKSGKVYELKDLFKENVDYVEILSSKVKAELSPDDLMAEFEKIKPKQDFYIQNNQLVIYFQLYEYTSYAYGIPEIKIPLSQISNLLNEDIKNKAFTSKTVSSESKFEVERISNGSITYPKVTNSVGDLKADYINSDIENLVGTYSAIGETSNSLKLDYEVSYVGDDYISLLFKGMQESESGEYQLLDALNYDVKTGYLISGQNLFNHDDEFIKSLNNTLNKYSEIPIQYSDQMGIYLRDKYIVLYYLQNDFDTEYTQIKIPKDEIIPFVGRIIEPLPNNEVSD